jgi:hypothetical protein
VLLIGDGMELHSINAFSTSDPLALSQALISSPIFFP